MIVSAFPTGWKTSVTVTRGGRDQAGNTSAPETFQIDGVLVGPSSTGDGGDWNEAPDDRATMWLDPGTFDFQPRDVVDIPEGRHPSGRWQVDGRPKPWPLGIEVQLRRRI